MRQCERRTIVLPQCIDNCGKLLSMYKRKIELGMFDRQLWINALCNTVGSKKKKKSR